MIHRLFGFVQRPVCDSYSPNDVRYQDIEPQGGGGPGRPGHSAQRWRRHGTPVGTGHQPRTQGNNEDVSPQQTPCCSGASSCAVGGGEWRWSPGLLHLAILCKEARPSPGHYTTQGAAVQQVVAAWGWLPVGMIVRQVENSGTTRFLGTHNTMKSVHPGRTECNGHHQIRAWATGPR